MATTTPDRRRPGRLRPSDCALILARTSTLALQDPYASLNRQITSGREWLPEGFYVAGYYWDVESGGLDIEQRGYGSYEQLTARGLPRDGGLADLLAEAKAPQPRFAAVVVEDIERSARDTESFLELERQLADQGIPLFATDQQAEHHREQPDHHSRPADRAKRHQMVPAAIEGKDLERAERAHHGGMEPRPPSPTGTCPSGCRTPTRSRHPRAAPKPG